MSAQQGPSLTPFPTVTLPLLLLLSAVLGGALLSTPSSPGHTGARAYDAAPAPVRSEGAWRGFQDATADVNLIVRHSQGTEMLHGLDETLGAGACVLDYDGDGWMDLFVIAGSGSQHYYGRREWWEAAGQNRLFRNTGGRFEDVTKRVGLHSASWAMGCAAADLDNDGDADLLVANRGANSLFRNNGDGTFSDVSVSSGLAAGDAWSSSFAVGDYDGDGLSDIYVVNYLRFAKTQYIYDSSTGYEAPTDSFFQSDLYDGEANVLLHNRGGLQFDDVTAGAGVANPGGRGLGARWLDLDGDRTPDLLVSNDAGVPDVAYRNLGVGRFETFATTGLESALASSAVISADVNNDGSNEVLVNTPAIAPMRIYSRVGTAAGGVRYADRARSLGLAAERQLPRRGWGLLAVDFDNDGDLDLFSANGLLSPTMEHARLPQGQANTLWLNDGTGHFRPCPDGVCLPLLDAEQSSRAAVAADFDSDGDMDVVVSNNNGFVQYLRNTAADPKPDAGGRVGTAPPLAAAPFSEPLYAVQSLVWQGGTGPAYEQLAAYAHHPDPEVRAATVAVAAGLRNPAGLRYLIGALDDPLPELRRAAVDALDPYESEFAMRWLLRALEDSDGSVACRSAQMFGRLFDEEEAVITRKGLAVPVLIRMLGSHDPQRRGCAADALATAEDFRALSPLLAMLNDPRMANQVAAVRTLGLTRERAAVKSLMALLAERRRAPVVRANAVAALLRLGNQDAPQVLVAELHADREQSASALAVYRAIFADGRLKAVVAPRGIAAEVQQWLAGPGARQAPSELLLQALDVLGSSGVTINAHSLSALLHSPDERVRVAAYELWLMQPGEGRRQGIAAAIADPAPVVIAAGLGAALRDGVEVDATSLARWAGNPLLQPAALTLWMRQEPDAALPALEQAVRQAVGSGQSLVPLLVALRSESRVTEALTPLLMAHPDAVTRAVALDYSAANLHRVGPLGAGLPDWLRRAFGDADTRVRGAALALALAIPRGWARNAAEQVLLSAGASLYPRWLDDKRIGGRLSTGSLLRLLAAPHWQREPRLYERLAARQGPLVRTALTQLVARSDDEQVRFLATRALHGALPPSQGGNER